MKNTNKIRLTESELHSVIKESVKQVFSELDWKTYANAAKGFKERASKAPTREKYKSDEKKSEKMMDMARDRFNQDYGYRAPHPNPEEGTSVVYDNNYPWLTYYTEQPCGAHKGSWSGYPAEELLKDDPSALDAYRRAKAEKENYDQGNYEYKKGKGWKLKNE